MRYRGSGHRIGGLGGLHSPSLPETQPLKPTGAKAQECMGWQYGRLTCQLKCLVILTNYSGLALIADGLDEISRSGSDHHSNTSRYICLWGQRFLVGVLLSCKECRHETER